MTAARAAKTATRVRTRTRPVVIKQDVRSAKAIETHRTNERARLRNYETIEKVAEEQQVLAAKTREYRARRSEVATETNAKAGRNAAYSGATAILQPKSDSNPILLILFVMFGLIVFYAMVTRPQPTSRFFGSLSNWLSLISTSTPLFSQKDTTSG